MSDQNNPVDPKSTPTPSQPRQEEQRAPGRSDATAEPKAKSVAALERLLGHIQGQRDAFAEQKRRVEEMRKELALFKASPDRLFAFADLPITEAQIGEAVDALKNGGLNVKSFQKALGIFDLSELTRVRKALVIAGVTVETENHKGSNSTWIELSPEFKPTGL